MEGQEFCSEAFTTDKAKKQRQPESEWKEITALHFLGDLTSQRDLEKTRIIQKLDMRRKGQGSYLGVI